MKYLSIFLILSMISGCKQADESTTLEKALKENPSLAMVLQKYESDSLKHLAAEFLIENLTYHEGYSEEQIKPYLKLYELFGTGQLSLEETYDSVQRMYGRIDTEEAIPVSDLYLSSDFLINNIEWAFKVWEEQPWGKNVSFTDFCEYILPYRIGDEPLKPWREKLYNIYNPMLDDIRKMPEATDPLFAARALSDSIRKHSEFRFSSSLGYGPHIGPDLVDWQAGNCQEMTDIMIYIFRAVGIPCGCDYMPLRGDANVAHFWNFTLDRYGDSHVVYNERQPEPVRQFWGGVKAKVYRKTFSLNKNILKNMGNPLTTSLHPDFRYPIYKDVTRLYSGKNARELFISCDSIFRKPMNGVVYLCEASWLDWIPIASTSIKGNEISFKDVEGGVVFILAIYENGKIMPISYPFEFDRKTGGIYFFHIADESEDIILLNKFNQFFESFPHRMLNGVFEGSNDPQFKVKDTLFIIKELPLRMYNVIYPKNNKKYRYARYYGPENSHCNIADIAFFASETDSITLKGHCIGTSNEINGDGKHDYTNAHDGNTLTSFDYYLPSGGWTGLDFGKPYFIKKIIFTPRNRDNYIRKGDTYELFYFNSEKWISAGTQIANADSLVYTVPKGTLYYLKNWSEGKDERIFEYDEKKQRYW